MNKKVGVNLEENRLEHSGSEVLEGDGAQEQKTAESGRELTGEEQNLKRLEEENERLRQEIERVRNLPLKERLYDKVHVSVRTLDIFSGDYEGLVLAEVEFQTEEDANSFVPPSWFTRDVTFSGEYQNSRLSSI